VSLTELYLGVDLGRSTRTAIVDGDGRVHSLGREPSRLESANDLVDGLVEFVNRTIRDTSGIGTIRSIGFGLPGLVEHPSNRVVMLPNLADVSEIDVAGLLSSATSLPVVLDNDANAAAYGEWRCGAAKGRSDFIYITLGTGIGAGIVQGGQLQRGARGFAGEFGHLKVTAQGLECGCGSSGCLETIASGPNIVRRTRERLFSDPAYSYSALAEKMRGRLTCEDVVEGAVSGDRLARAILAETGLFLGMTIANVVNLMNIELVVLGGPVMRDNDVLLDAVIHEARRRAFGPSFEACEIASSALGDDAGVIGAAIMARDAIHGSLDVAGRP